MQTSEEDKKRFRHMKKLYNERFVEKTPAGWAIDEENGQHAVYDEQTLKDLNEQFDHACVLFKGTESEIHIFEDELPVGNLKESFAVVGYTEVDKVLRVVGVRAAEYHQRTPLTSALPEGFVYPEAANVEAVAQEQKAEWAKKQAASAQREKTLAEIRAKGIVHLSPGMQTALREMVKEYDNADSTAHKLLAANIVISTVRLMVQKDEET